MRFTTELIAPVAVAMAVLAGVALRAEAAEVYRWTDENGRVNYGVSAPPEKRTDARTVDTSGAKLNDTDRNAAANRLARDQAYLRSPSLTASAPVFAASSPVTSVPRQDAPASCQEAWKRYNESYACFDPYRARNGMVKAEGFARCKQLPRPDPCR